LVEASLDGIKTTFAPLRELLKDNQAVESREEHPPNPGDGPSTASFTKETALPGLNLEGASLDDLKRLKKLVSKKIKAVSKQKVEPETNASEMMISYQKVQEEVSLGATEMATRTETARQPASNQSSASQKTYTIPKGSLARALIIKQMDTAPRIKGLERSMTRNGSR